MKSDAVESYRQRKRKTDTAARIYRANKRLINLLIVSLAIDLARPINSRVGIATATGPGRQAKRG